MQDTISRISEQFKGLCLLHAIALEIFKNLQLTNNFDLDNQGPPAQYTNCFDLDHWDPPSQNINRSDLDQQGPPPQTQGDSSDFGHQEQSPSLRQIQYMIQSKKCPSTIYLTSLKNQNILKL